MKPRTLRASLTLLCLAVLVGSVPGHHIMGIPHYAYDKNYPQAPVITYKVAAGPYIVELTGYPGKPVPQELSQMHAYIYEKGDRKRIFPGPIQASVTRQSLGGREIVFGPTKARFEEKLHKFTPTYDQAGTYHVRLEMRIEGQPYEIDFPIVVGDPRSPMTMFLGWAGVLMFLVVVVRAIKIKRARRMASFA